MRGLVIMTTLFFGFVLARNHVFKMDAPKPTPDLYNKPIFIWMLRIPRQLTPQGFSTPDQAPQQTFLPKTVSPAEIAQRVPQIGRADLPNQKAIHEYLVDVYTGTLGEKVTIVTAGYKNREALTGLDPARVKAPRFLLMDHCLTWIDAESDEAALKFHKVLSDHAQAQKRRRVEMEKVKVASTAYLKFFADILVGAFGFVLALFFMKYFLITRQVEH
ncbi:MAG: hypothetical protein HY815_13475 [Candidatus Riflebacteria bacterium]|nr:hypothetical protein [Candidatus Riflebacteria bacterium]